MSDLKERANSLFCGENIGKYGRENHASHRKIRSCLMLKSSNSIIAVIILLHLNEYTVKVVAILGYQPIAERLSLIVS